MMEVLVAAENTPRGVGIIQLSRVLMPYHGACNNVLQTVLALDIEDFHCQCERKSWEYVRITRMGVPALYDVAYTEGTTVNEWISAWTGYDILDIMTVVGSLG